MIRFINLNLVHSYCDKNCAICPYITGNYVFVDKDGHKYYAKRLIKCDAKNLIYGIHCEQCKNIIYLGETMNTLYQRHQLNRSRIQTGRNRKPVSAHLRNENHWKNHRNWKKKHTKMKNNEKLVNYFGLVNSKLRNLLASM